VSRDIGNAGVAVRADGDHALVVTADDAFADQFGPWASTGLPVTVVEFHNGAFTDATRQHLDLVTADAARWWAALTGGNVIQLGQLAPWVADQCLLGQGTHAWATVNGLQVLHRLD